MNNHSYDLKTVLKFISLTNDNFKSVETIDIFTRGMCYWYAWILHGRFPQSIIVYDEVMNHFGCEIGDYVYDITGDVTKFYNWEPWCNIYVKDPLHAARIERDCIYVGEVNND